MKPKSAGKLEGVYFSAEDFIANNQACCRVYRLGFVLVERRE